MVQNECVSALMKSRQLSLKEKSIYFLIHMHPKGIQTAELIDCVKESQETVRVSLNRLKQKQLIKLIRIKNDKQQFISAYWICSYKNR